MRRRREDAPVVGLQVDAHDAAVIARLAAGVSCNNSPAPCTPDRRPPPDQRYLSVPRPASKPLETPSAAHRPSPDTGKSPRPSRNAAPCPPGPCTAGAGSASWDRSPAAPSPSATFPACRSAGECRDRPHSVFLSPAPSSPLSALKSAQRCANSRSSANSFPIIPDNTTGSEADAFVTAKATGISWCVSAIKCNP